MLCIPSGSMQIGCRALYCTHSCQAYAAYLFMLDFLKSIYFALGIERPSELFGQMLSIPTSSNPLRVVTQWPVSTTCQWGYMGFVWASISPPRVCFAVYAWRFWCGCVQCFCWVRMAWQEQAAIVLFMLWRGSCNPVLEKGFSHGGMFHEISHRVSTKEQKCSFGFRMYVRHRGAIVWKAVCMIWSVRNGAERLPCLPGICITISGIHCYLL